MACFALWLPSSKSIATEGWARFFHRTGSSKVINFNYVSIKINPLEQLADWMRRIFPGSYNLCNGMRCKMASHRIAQWQKIIIMRTMATEAAARCSPDENLWFQHWIINKISLYDSTTFFHSFWYCVFQIPQLNSQKNSDSKIGRHKIGLTATFFVESNPCDWITNQRYKITTEMF